MTGGKRGEDGYTNIGISREWEELLRWNKKNFHGFWKSIIWWKMKILFHLKSSFHSQDVQIFIFWSSPFFVFVNHCFRSWFKKNLKVYDIINCLNRKLIIHFSWYLGKEKRYETLSIDRILNKKYFYGKIMQKMCTKS